MKLTQKQYILIGIIALLIFIWWQKRTKKPQKTWSMENDKKIKELHPKIQFAVSSLINRASTELGINLVINSGFRGEAEQKAFNDAKGKWAAAPGRSYHNYGLAVDISVKSLTPTQLKWVVAVSTELGFEWGGKWKTTPEPWHFQMTFGFKTSQFAADKKAGKFVKYPNL
jgi:peptidoglycan LD-endopeptidase CwlK